MYLETSFEFEVKKLVNPATGTFKYSFNFGFLTSIPISNTFFPERAIVAAMFMDKKVFPSLGKVDVTNIVFAVDLSVLLLNKNSKFVLIILNASAVLERLFTSIIWLNVVDFGTSPKKGIEVFFSISTLDLILVSNKFFK